MAAIMTFVVCKKNVPGETNAITPLKRKEKNKRKRTIV